MKGKAKKNRNSKLRGRKKILKARALRQDNKYLNEITATEKQRIG